MHHLHLYQLSCARGDHIVFSDLDRDLPGGGCTLVTGANGSGKSSLLRILAGLLAPQTGTIYLDEQPVRPRDLAMQAIYCSPVHALKADLNVRANLEFFTSLYGYPGEVIAAALDDLGIADIARTPARHLSAGMQRRVILARLAIARHAAPGARPIWLLDEPEDSLDSAALERLNALLAAHHNDGGLSIIASHRAAIKTHVNATIDLDAQRIKYNTAA